MSESASLLRPPLGEVHHYAYLVDDIEATVGRLVEQLGAGPFFVVDDVQFDSVASQGAPAEFAHSSAFGHCGGGPIELMEITRLAPERVSERFAGPRPRLHHIAWVVAPDSVVGVREQLERRGLPQYLHTRVDAVDSTFHDGSAAFGHDLEIHADVEALQGFFAIFREAAETWDGTEPIRPAPG